MDVHDADRQGRLKSWSNLVVVEFSQTLAPPRPPILVDASGAGRQAQRAEADRFARQYPADRRANPGPNGARTLREIGTALNVRGICAARGW